MCISEISRRIAARENVSIDNLEYIGVTDASMLKTPRMLHNFNILDKDHPRYKTTVVWSQRVIN